MDDALAGQIASTFALGSLASSPTLAARGANGFIWKVTTDRGAYAVKRLQPWIADDPVPFDVGVQLAAADAGIELPRPVLAPDGRAVVERTRVYEWADLAEACPTPVSPATATEVGAILGRFHGLGLPPDGFDPWYVTPPSLEVWRDLEARGQVAGAPWTSWLSNFLKVCCDQSLDDQLKGEFTDTWIERLRPDGLRRRLLAVDRLIEAFAT